MSRILGAYWSEARIKRLGQLQGEGRSARLIANRLGTTTAEVKRAQLLLGLIPLPAPAQPRAVPDGARRLQALAAPTGHCPQDLLAYGWVNLSSGPIAADEERPHAG